MIAPIPSARPGVVIITMRAVGFPIIILLAALASGCGATVPVNTAPASARAQTEAQIAPEATRTRIGLYECPTYGDVVVHYNFGEVTLILKNETYVLPQTVAASGTKFSDQGNLFWEKTPEAMVALGGKLQETCKSDPDRAAWVDAWRRGVSFRGQGTDPAWWVDILDGDHITLGLDDGTYLVHGPAEQPTLEKGSRVYHSDSDEGKLTVTIAPLKCKIDNEPGEYPSTVTVTLRDTSYEGCGEAAER
jgi:membrane-bound inhibitor of C-type lysozyme/uncharacterized membrane protein